MYKIICNQEGAINYGIDQSSSRCIWRNNGRSVEGVFYCDAIDKDVLVVKGEKRVGGRSSNKKAVIILFQAVPELLLQMVSV